MVDEKTLNEIKEKIKNMNKYIVVKAIQTDNYFLFESKEQAQKELEFDIEDTGFYNYTNDINEIDYL